MSTKDGAMITLGLGKCCICGESYVRGPSLDRSFVFYTFRQRDLITDCFAFHIDQEFEFARCSESVDIALVNRAWRP